MSYELLETTRSPQKYEHDAVTRWTVNTCRIRMLEGGYKQSHLSFEHGFRLFLQRFSQVNTSSLIFKPLKRKRMKPLTENAQQKNSDSHIYFVTQEIVYKTLRLNLSLLASSCSYFYGLRVVSNNSYDIPYFVWNSFP